MLPRWQQPVFEADVQSGRDWERILQGLKDNLPDSPSGDIRSAAYIPFVIDEVNKISGTLLLCWNRPQRFDTKRQLLLQDRVIRAAAALRPSAWQRQTQLSIDQRIGELARLREIGLGFAKTHDLKDLMKQVLQVSLAESEMRRGSIRLLNEDKSALILRASENVPDEALVENLDLNELLRRSLDSDQCVLVDTQADPLWADYMETLGQAERLDHVDIRSILHVPIRLHGEGIGLILLESSQVRRVSKQIQEYLEILGTYAAAVAIDSARIIELAQPLTMMGTMLGGFLHVMLNRINDLFAIVTNLSDAELTPVRLRQKTEALRTELKRLEEVCRDLAHFTRIDPVSVSEEVSLNSVIHRAWAGFNASQREHIRLIPWLVEPSPVAKGNSIQIELAFRMIVQNAIEAMRDGGELTVRTIYNNGCTMVSFRDTGDGMDEVTRRRCLEPFFTTKAQRGGTGLGLAVVVGIMTRHGGRVEVQSQKGQGSTFILTFPAVGEAK
jgi:signal transduction histidine kinase